MSDMSDSQKRGKQEGEFEVTGVSRSGRVRKKSSKLLDFESPDEIDSRYKRKGERGDISPPPVSTVRSRGTPVYHLEKPHQVNIKIEPRPDLSDSEEQPIDSIKNEPGSSESDSEFAMLQPPEGLEDESSLDSLGSDVDDEDLDDDAVVEGEPKQESQDGNAAPQAHSLYMLEKSTKKKLIVKDGKIVGRMKAQRKDKGKTRFTAYMLWAKEIRQEIARMNPEMDFSTMSKRLGELWATVPNNEKYNWKRRAKRLAVKGSREAASNIDTTRWKAPPSRSKFINKSGTGRSATSVTPPKISPTQSQVSPQPDQKTANKSNVVTEPLVGPGLYKVVGTQPVDVAAHLKLLGESLAIIGERLKEHEGQIAVSGSLSVLLDSLLCAVGPLVCLTQQMQETNGCPQETLSKILDNIAYFMPGL